MSTVYEAELLDGGESLVPDSRPPARFALKLPCNQIEKYGYDGEEDGPAFVLREFAGQYEAFKGLQGSPLIVKSYLDAVLPAEAGKEFILEFGQWELRGLHYVSCTSLLIVICEEAWLTYTLAGKRIHWR